MLIRTLGRPKISRSLTDAEARDGDTSGGGEHIMVCFTNIQTTTQTDGLVHIMSSLAVRQTSPPNGPHLIDSLTQYGRLYWRLSQSLPTD
jgi:hypothetical protein